MTAENMASALKLQQDGQEIAALLVENAATFAEREGRPMQPSDYLQMIGPLLAATWEVAKLAGPDRTIAKAEYVRFLRDFADGVDRAATPL